MLSKVSHSTRLINSIIMDNHVNAHMFKIFIFTSVFLYLLQSKLDLAVGEKVTDTDKLLELSKSVIHYSVKTGKENGMRHLNVSLN